MHKSLVLASHICCFVIRFAAIEQSNSSWENVSGDNGDERRRRRGWCSVWVTGEKWTRRKWVFQICFDQMGVRLKLDQMGISYLLWSNGNFRSWINNFSLGAVKNLVLYWSSKRETDTCLRGKMTWDNTPLSVSSSNSQGHWRTKYSEAALTANWVNWQSFLERECR